MSRIAGRFARVEPRRRVRDLMLGLLSDLPRKNCWSIAEWAGEDTPDGMQPLLGRARWDADAVRDDVREYVLEHLHDEGAVLVVDETGDVKKGTHTRSLTGKSSRWAPGVSWRAASHTAVRWARRHMLSGRSWRSLSQTTVGVFRRTVYRVTSSAWRCRSQV
ncbi:transposase [Streptomyces sp. NPDC045431]|uniref:transposase n=1 Tax=Streptomyces sp. NPDC045431 TaxID=3155613 RepID=UPI0033E00BDF